MPRRASGRSDCIGREHLRASLAWLLVIATACNSALETVPRGSASTVDERAAMANFADPDRRSKLLAVRPVMDSMFRAFADRAHVPGIAYGLIIDGELVHIGVHGLREIESRSPVDSTTVFRIASMTKSFTALAILKLRDEGKLSLGDLAERYVPELAGLKYPTTDSPRLTILHLLSHATGFPEDNPWGDQQLDATDEAMNAMMRSGIPFSNPPGVAYEYSNYGFAILGRIVANVSRQPYATYVRTHILDPLGLSSTTLEFKDVAPERFAHGYRWQDNEWKLEPPLPDGAFGAMGGMLTSIHDLGKYVAFLSGAFPPRDGADDGPVSRASVREMQQIWRSRPARVTRSARGDSVVLNTGGYGYGLGISQSCLFGHVVAHSGGLPGFGSQMRWLPEYGVGIIALGNLTYTGWGGVITQAFDALAATGALEPRMPVPSAALASAREAVTRLVNNWDDALADSVAAMNLKLDDSWDYRRTRLIALHSDVGTTCRNEGPFLVENALRGRWRMRCGTGRSGLEVSITLAPTIPPKVQHLDVQIADFSRPLAAAPTCSERAP